MNTNIFGNEPVTDPKIIQSIKTMKSNLNSEIEELEEQLKQLQSSPTDSNQKNTMQTLSRAPHWDQIVQYINIDQKNEAIYALVRVVQRLLDEKSSKKTLDEKANKNYVDSLLDIVSSGIQKNLERSTLDSICGLNEKVNKLHKKINSIRQFMENELRKLESSVNRLTRSEENEEEEVFEEAGSTLFSVH